MEDTMKTKEQHRKYNLNCYYKRRNKLIEQLGGKCVRCGSTENLEFDHIDSNSKRLDVSKRITSNINVINQELAKCQLLCRSCHIQKTKEKKDANATISSTDVANIRKEYITSDITQERLGEKYGLKQSEIGNILRGLRWKQNDENPMIQEKIDEKRKRNNTLPNTNMAIDMIDPETNTIIKTYNSMSEARQDGYKVAHISECCHGKANTHGGYKWQFHNKA